MAIKKTVYQKPEATVVYSDFVLSLMQDTNPGGSGSGDVEELSKERRGGLFSSPSSDEGNSFGSNKLW